MIVNYEEASRDAILMHMGLGFLEAYYCQADIEAGKLVHVLPDYHYGTKDRAYYLYYPNRENLAPKVRVFVDFLVQHLAD